jgi:glycosyltransferase involved in cell wall biosynthesis
LPQDPEAGAAPFLEMVSAAGTARSGARGDERTEQLLERLERRPVPSLLHPYLDPGRYRSLYRSWQQRNPAGSLYGPDLIAEVIRYGRAGAELAPTAGFDVIHVHDWMTAPAGLLARSISGRPLVMHVHSLEYDRSGEAVNPEIEEIEREGVRGADRIVAVSHRTRRMLVERYGVDPSRISVVYNAVTRQEGRRIYRTETDRSAPGRRRIILFLGRITFQKGPDYFVEAAHRVLTALPDVTFVMAGEGDMLERMIERVGELGIGERFHFTGFLQGEQIERIFSMSDLYVMPSVSEPFGISPLEAMMYDVPVILSRQSGVSEILRHALKVDFWDVQELASKIIAVLKYPAVAHALARHAREELKRIRWETAGRQVEAVYREALRNRGEAG